MVTLICLLGLSTSARAENENNKARVEKLRCSWEGHDVPAQLAKISNEELRSAMTQLTFALVEGSLKELMKLIPEKGLVIDGSMRKYRYVRRRMKRELRKPQRFYEINPGGSGNVCWELNTPEGLDIPKAEMPHYTYLHTGKRTFLFREQKDGRFLLDKIYNDTVIWGGH